MQATTARYDQGYQLGLVAFTAAVFGGVGNLAGAVLGAVLIGLVQSFNEGLITSRRERLAAPALAVSPRLRSWRRRYSNSGATP